MTQVPFLMSSTHVGFGRCEGMINLDGDSLRFELQSKVVGVIKSAIKLVEVPLSDIGLIEYKSGLFSTTVRIQFKTLRHTQDFPRAEGNEILLEIRRPDRDRAQQLVTEAKMAIVSKSLDEMLEMTDPAID